jgi:hypothetical protein
MPSISSWMRTKAQILFDHPDTGSTEYSTASFSPENEIALFCHCHPDEKQYHPNFLCEACRRFVKTCHWVQNYKLPSAQFSKLSKRQWKRGAYVADGDAVEGLNWDYEYSLSDRSVGCHLCELIGTLWEGTGSDLGYTDAWPSSRIKLSVYYDTHDKGHARLRVSACDDVDPGAYASLKLYHEWISGELN